MIKSERKSIQGLQEAGLIGVVLVLSLLLAYLGYYYARPGQENLFLNSSNFVEGIATPMSIFTIMAIGMTCVIITGGIDISVGSTMALAALGGAATVQYLSPDAPAWKVLPVAFGIPMLIGLACGAINGACVVGLRLHPFIVTLGTMSIFRGLGIVLSKPYSTFPSGDNQVPISFTPRIMRWHLGEMNFVHNPDFMRKWGFIFEKLVDLEIVPMLLMLFVVALGFIYLSLMIAGRETYAVGGNEEAARFSGIRVGRAKFRAYLICGLCAGFAAVVQLGRFGSASTNTADGYELIVVAGAVIGGASLSGGRGGALGALLGTLIIAMLDDGIQFMNKTEYRKIIVGVAIIVAVTIERQLRGGKN